MPAPAALRPWRPKDGLEAADFARAWCSRCALAGAAGRSCPLMGRAAAHPLGHPHYPPEFQIDAQGFHPRCLRFAEVGRAPSEPGAILDTRQDTLAF